MGKRELLIVAGFAAAGVVAFLFTATPSSMTSRHFSLGNLISSIRRQARANLAHATVTTHGTVPVARTATRVRVAGVAVLQVIGEARDTIGYELTVESNGADQDAARQLADRTVLQQDLLGPVISLRVAYPRDGHQTVRLTLRLPVALGIEMQTAAAGTRLDVSGIGNVDLGNVVGDVRLTAIGGRVTGTHRNGDLTIAGAGAVDLSLFGSRATIADVRGTVSLTAHNGSCRVERPGGAVTLEQTGVDSTIVAAAAGVSVTGANGRLTIDRPRGDTTVDVRNIDVQLTIDAAAPITALTVNAPIHVTVAGTPAVVIDAIATDGAIRAPDLGATPRQGDHEMRLDATIGAGSARVVLRTERADIEIHRMK
jgi:hypothetical protein